MQAPRGFVDDGRTVLFIEGGDAHAVLQSTVTNDVDQVAPGRAVYAALLTPQGKYLADFFLLDGGPDRILIDIATDRAMALAQRLKMYCLRRDAKIGQTDMTVALAWPAAGTPPDGAVEDPRAAALGWRIYGGTIPPLTGSRADYDALRIQHLVPATGMELNDDTFILEAGFERLSGVDFRKGCYVGQEVTARMKHKTELRKGLVRVHVTGDVDPGSPITADGKPAGTLFTVADGQGLAHLRLDRAGPGMAAGAARVDYEAADSAASSDANPSR